MEDAYFTIDHPSEGIYKEKGSKFISYLYPVEIIEESDNRIAQLKKDHPKSRHVCYAYRIGYNAYEYRINDDGEPSGTAGRPIMNELLSADITNVILAVVRYFGGKKLGASGLINAYKSASRDAIEQTDIVQKFITKTVRVHFDIKDMGRLYNSIKHLNLEFGNEHLLQKSSLDVELRMSQTDQLCNELKAHFHGLSLDHVKSDGFKSQIKLEEL